MVLRLRRLGALPAPNLDGSGERARRWNLLPYVLAAPVVLLVGTFIFAPVVSGLWTSLHRGGLGTPLASWAGLDNYGRLVSDPITGNTFLVTTLYAVAVVTLAVGTGLATALALNRRFRLRAVARTLLTVPWVIPEIAAVLLFPWILNPSFGVANVFARLLPWVTESPTWLIDPALAFPLVVLITTWKVFPFFTLVILAALQTVPSDLYEAARVDGAGAYRAFRHITLPWLVPTLALSGILATIYAFKQFTLIWLITGGGPGIATQTLVVRTYNTAFRYFDVQYADAMGTLGLLATLVITVAFLYVLRRFES